MRPGLRWIAYWLVVVGCFAFVAYVFVDARLNQAGVAADAAAAPQSTLAASPTTGATATPTPSTSATRTRALFVGEAYQVGGAGVAKRNTVARLACAKLGWSCTYDAVTGSGYLAGRTYDQRLSADAAASPDVVVVSSGRADLGLTGAQRAANRYLSELAKRFPDATVVVVEPFWNDDLGSTAMTQLRSDVHAAARSADATWVPSKGWVDTAMLAPGGLQLTAAGHQQVATKLIAKLRVATAGG